MPVNEPIKNYAKGDADRTSVEKKLVQMAGEKIKIPCIINGKEVHTSQTKTVVMPHDHGHVLAEYSWAGPEELSAAAQGACAAQKEWEARPWKERSQIFLKAAELLIGPYRDILNASTMLGQSKNIFQAEIDAACELIDFFKFNASFYEDIQKIQPLSVPGIRNSLEYRSLEGFVLAITPFNFTSIAANLPAAPAMLGNACVWKPSDTQVFSAYYSMKLLEEAGLPPGVINFVPADGPVAGDTLLRNRELAGVHFTGSTQTFQTIWRTVGENIKNYKSYPRLVGETGGKDFIFAHPSADIPSLATAMVRGAYEYQGQKCSAASRAYIPESIWKKLKPILLEQIESITMGDPRDFSHLMNAVIDQRSFTKITGYIDHAKNASDAEILAGGKGNSDKGYFVEPTLIQTSNPRFKTMVEEIFGPVLTVYVYPDNAVGETLKLCDEASPYALTGAVFAQDKQAIEKVSKELRYTAGNFYINDKPTGAVVGQQPFGGSRASGTNDKAGSILNLYRFISARTVKETAEPPTDYRYPHML